MTDEVVSSILSIRLVTERLIGLPPDLARLIHVATSFLVPWPAAIGYRRFYQGILVRHHLPRRVAYGTVVRLVTMSVAAVALATLTRAACPRIRAAFVASWRPVSRLVDGVC